MTKSDIFDAALIAAAKKCGQDEVDYYMSLPLAEHDFSRRHDRRMKNLFRREKYAGALKVVKSISKRAVAAVLVVCTVLFVTVISIEAIREDIWSEFTVFFKEYLSFGKENPNEQGYITEYKSPAWLPEGYEEDTVTKTVQSYDIFYTNEDGDLLAYMQHMYNYSSVWYDNEGVVITDITVNGLDGKFLEYDEEKDSVIIWYDDECSYSILASLPKDIMLKIAENVR